MAKRFSEKNLLGNPHRRGLRRISGEKRVLSRYSLASLRRKVADPPERGVEGSLEDFERMLGERLSPVFRAILGATRWPTGHITREFAVYS